MKALPILKVLTLINFRNNRINGKMANKQLLATFEILVAYLQGHSLKRILRLVFQFSK